MERGHVQVEEQAVEGNGPMWKLVVRQGCKGETTPISEQRRGAMGC